MKKNFRIHLFILMLGTWMLWSCTKDEGTYTSNPINEVSFQGLETLQGYRVNLGDTLRIDPGVAGTANENKSATDYQYEWRLILSATDDHVVSTEKKLELPVNFKPGSYPLTLRVNDPSTSITWMAKTTLNITTIVYEGYLVLNEIRDTARLDFLSYNNQQRTFTPYINVQEKLGVPMAPAAAPRQISFQYTTTGGAFLFLLTDNGNWLLDPETFAFNKNLPLKALISGPLPTGFQPLKIEFKRYLLNFLMPWIFSDHDVFHSSATTSMSFISSPINYYTQNNQWFKPAPFRVVDEIGYRIVLYDETNKRFATSSNAATTYTSEPVDPLLNFPTGKELVYMGDNGGLFVFGTGVRGYAVMKDPGTSHYFMLRFSFEGSPFLGPPKPVPNYFEAMDAPDIDLATQFAISPTLEYVFYNAGGKLYEYDLSLKTSKLMLDVGNYRISYLNFDLNATGSADMKNWLIVGTYDPNGDPGANGKLSLYEVPPVNGALNKKFEWTGLGKVTSVSYRYRN